MRRLTLLAGLFAAAVPATASAQTVAEGPARVPVTINEPAIRPATAARIAGLKVPDGFRVSVAARRLGPARMLAVAGDRTLLITRRDEGDVLALRDRDGDGAYEQRRTAIRGLTGVHGIALRGRTVHLVTDRRLYRASLRGTRIVDRELLRSDLPDVGQHPNRTIAWGPDNYLYLTIGSTCNACDEGNRLSATMTRVRGDGTRLRVYATGLRNTIGFGWDDRDRLWGFDHGTDFRGDDQPPEELNRIVANGDYGWPFCFGDRRPDVFTVADPKKETEQEYCAKTRAPALTYTAHGAPIGMAFAAGRQFPVAYRDDAFVAMRGSWNRGTPSGYEVVRVSFERGRPAAYEPFLSGFLTAGGREQFARLTGLTFDRDGSLLVTDDQNGVLYRVSATG